MDKTRVEGLLSASKEEGENKGRTGCRLRRLEN